MKIKNLLVMALVVTGLAMTSCDALKDLTAVEVDTDINVDLPLEDDETVSLKSADLAGTKIVGNGILNLADNDDVKAYVAGIRNIKTKEAFSKITGVTNEDEITNLVVKATLNKVEYVLYKQASGIILTKSLVEKIDMPLAEVQRMIAALETAGYDSSINFSITGDSKEKIGSRLKLKITLPSTVSYSPL